MFLDEKVDFKLQIN